MLRGPSCPSGSSESGALFCFEHWRVWSHGQMWKHFVLCLPCHVCQRKQKLVNILWVSCSRVESPASNWLGIWLFISASVITSVRGWSSCELWSKCRRTPGRLHGSTFHYHTWRTYSRVFTLPRAASLLESPVSKNDMCVLYVYFYIKWYTYTVFGVSESWRCVTLWTYVSLLRKIHHFWSNVNLLLPFVMLLRCIWQTQDI